MFVDERENENRIGSIGPSPFDRVQTFVQGEELPRLAVSEHNISSSNNSFEHVWGVSTWRMIRHRLG